MFYLGCDQHARQITICLRNEAGDVVQNLDNAFLDRDPVRRPYESRSSPVRPVCVTICGWTNSVVTPAASGVGHSRED